MSNNGSQHMIAANAADLGAILRDARRSKRLSQMDLAAIIGVSRQWVISAEQGAPTARVDLMLDALLLPPKEVQFKSRLAMKLGGHYKLRDIQARHLAQVAQSVDVDGDWMLDTAARLTYSCRRSRARTV